MYRRLLNGLPADPSFPTTLAALGFRINADDQLQRIDKPDAQYVFKITNNQRYNEMFRERVYDALRDEIETHLKVDNIMQKLYLPHFEVHQTKGEEACLPVYCSNNIRTARHVIVLVQDQYDDWLIWSRATLTDVRGIAAGSVLGLSRAVANMANTALVVLNPCQLLYSHEERRAMSRAAWDARKRPSFMHPPPTIDDKWNRLAYNETAEKHAGFVLSELLGHRSMMDEHAKISLICIGGGYHAVMPFLKSHLSKENHRISAVAFTTRAPAPFEIGGTNLSQFLAIRSRAWKLSHLPEDSVLSVPKEAHLAADFDIAGMENESPFEDVSCPVFSAGKLGDECDVFTNAYDKILRWLDEVAAHPDYVNPEFVPAAGALASDAQSLAEDEERGWAVADDSWT